VTLPVAIIDVWDIETFDAELRSSLDAHADLIQDYMSTNRRQWLEREASDHTGAHPENTFASAFMRVEEYIVTPLVKARTIRAWHYTRMTDREVDIIRRDGIYPSSIANFRARLDAEVVAGSFSAEIADRLFTDSPYQSGQRASRSGKFWAVSNPHSIDDSGVELLVESWGGEAAYFWQRDKGLQELLKQIGHARVLEVAIPLSYSRHAFYAARAVVATYGRMLGCVPDNGGFDLYTSQPLPAQNVIVIHSDGDRSFATMARGYPASFIEPDD
jgi:hypothetical protein